MAADGELFRVMLGLLALSWKQVRYSYSELTPNERELITKEQHARLVLVMRHARPVSGATPDVRAKHLAARSMLYAEQAVEGLELEAVVGEEYTMAAGNRDMDRITAALATAMVVGYGACLDDQLPVERLGGVTEGRKRGKR